MVTKINDRRYCSTLLKLLSLFVLQRPRPHQPHQAPLDTEDELKAKWAKTPRVKWQHYQKIQPSQDEIKQWHSQYPLANWAAITGITFAVVDIDCATA